MICGTILFVVIDAAVVEDIHMDIVSKNGRLGMPGYPSSEWVAPRRVAT